ncbi:MAG: hypothetical protein K9K30_08260 [Burkholderiaceae bacterium]|nr:hypothetical protein [Sulfuritalea sp.]MCF8175217.1 hypothetical protein [Burkholderiaceae bacterium]MCF8183365.1 hypothetical protein [Polynucleobacter sp.]
MENTRRIHDVQERRTRRARRPKEVRSRRAYREITRITQAILTYLQLTMEVPYGQTRF